MILSTLLNCLKKYTSSPIVVAFSGGVDSQVLLHAVAALKQSQKIHSSITAIHINHGLNVSANDWQALTEQQCKALAIDYKTLTVDVVKTPRTSLEALARDKRYEALGSLSPSDAIILTGHHQDDQVETFLLACKRGSGLKGLSAMAEESEFGQAQQRLVRPLLNISRNSIEHYANEHKLEWIEDDSNNDQTFDRNFLRQNIIPQLKERWQGIDQTIARSANHCQEAQILLDEIAVEDLSKCSINQNTLCIPSLQALTPARFNNVIRYFLKENDVLMPSSAQLIEIKNQLNAKPDKSPVVQLNSCCFQRYKECLVLTPIYENIQHWERQLNVESQLNIENQQEEKLTLQLPDDLGHLQIGDINQLSPSGELSNVWSSEVLLPSKEQKVVIRFSHHNPKCLPEYRQHSKALKKILQELEIAPWQRKRIPFLYYGDELVAALGYFVCKAFKPDESTKNVSTALNIHWYKQ